MRSSDEVDLVVDGGQQPRLGALGDRGQPAQGPEGGRPQLRVGMGGRGGDLVGHVGQAHPPDGL